MLQKKQTKINTIYKSQSFPIALGKSHLVKNIQAHYFDHGEADSTPCQFCWWNKITKEVFKAIETFMIYQFLQVHGDSYSSTSTLEGWKNLFENEETSFWNFLQALIHTRSWQVELDGLYNKVQRSLIETLVQKKVTDESQKIECVCTPVSS